MRVCLLGKYPPIEGGVSTTTYWLARGLAGRGHEVHVVTNAGDVEEAYRLNLDAVDPADDASWYQPSFPDAGGRVLVHDVERFDPVRSWHIPLANPSVSRLAGRATDVVRMYGCDVLLAFYYEPYAVAGWLVSMWTGQPLVTKHAGSDLERLFRQPDLATTYKEVLQAADAVVTQPELMPRFRGMGVQHDRLVTDPGYGLCREAFDPAAGALDLGATAVSSGWAATGASPLAFDATAPTIGVYGKVGRPKGTFDLIEALGHVADGGLLFNLAAMIGAPQARLVEHALRDAHLIERTVVLPLLPNWRVPGFIRACTAVCCLERDFPVAGHGPIVPREVLACGTCLVLSREVAAKQRYRDGLAHGENVLIVDDPRDVGELAATLRSLVEDVDRATAIGARGAALSASLEDHEVHVRRWEELLGEVASSSRPVTVTRPGRQAPCEVSPGLRAYLAEQAPDLTPGPGFGGAVAFCDEVLGHFGRGRFDALGEQRDRIAAAVRFERARLLTRHDPASFGAPAFWATDRLGRRSVTDVSVAELRPLRSDRLLIETFRHDVTRLMADWAWTDGGTADQRRAALAAVPGTPDGSPVVVLFLRSVNLAPRELRIDRATRRLLALCDGTRTTRQVISEMSRPGAGDPAAVPSAQPVLTALGNLHRLGVIVFAEHRDGWGWTGGVIRSPS